MGRGVKKWLKSLLGKSVMTEQKDDVIEVEAATAAAADAPVALVRATSHGRGITMSCGGHKFVGQGYLAKKALRALKRVVVNNSWGSNVAPVTPAKGYIVRTKSFKAKLRSRSTPVAVLPVPEPKLESPVPMLEPSMPAPASPSPVVVLPVLEPVLPFPEPKPDPPVPMPAPMELQRSFNEVMDSIHPLLEARRTRMEERSCS